MNLLTLMHDFLILCDVIHKWPFFFIQVDGMRSVRGFHFDRAAASVLTTSLSVCEENYLFLGSRLGNSLLLQFTEKDIGESTAVFLYPFLFLPKNSRHIRLLQCQSLEIMFTTCFKNLWNNLLVFSTFEKWI